MSAFSNKIGKSDSNKVLKLTEKQVFENDYERLKNKFNFGNINLNKNINSFPLRLSSPNHNEPNSINNSKNDSNHYINSHKICYNYPSKGNKDDSEDINTDKIHNFIMKNNPMDKNKPESRNNSTTKNFYKQESLTSKSKENLIVNYKIKQNNNSTNQTNKKISYLKREERITDGKNRRTTNTHASTVFRYSDKSIDMTSSNNSFISHSFLNNMNNNFNQKNIPCKVNEDFQAKIERYNSNGNLINYIHTNNTNINTQATSQSNFNIDNPNETEKIRHNLIKNDNGDVVHHKKVNSNIIAYNNFNKLNKMNANNIDKRNNSSLKNGIKNINTSSYKSLAKKEVINKNNISYSNNRTTTTIKSVSTSINLSRKGTSTNKNRFNEESKKMKSSKNNNESNTVLLEDNRAESNLFKITYIKIVNPNKNPPIKPENISMINKILDADTKLIKKINNESNNIYQKNQIDSSNSKKNKGKNENYTNFSEQNHINIDETERKTDRCFNTNNNFDENDEENDIAFANALEDLSQSNESSINELILPLNKKSKTYSSQNIPSEENVDRKDVIYSDKVLINNDKYQKSRDNMNVDGFVEELEDRNTYSKDKDEGEEDLDNYDSFENYAMHQINTRNLFINNPVYDLSSRLINDEKANHLQPVRNFQELKFIEKIKKDRKNNYLNLKKFWLLNDDCIWNILSFSFQFFQEIVKSNGYLAKKLYLTLSNKFSHVIYSFRENFKEYLELEEFLFRPGVVKKHRAKKPNNVIDLVFKSRIKSRLFNNTFEICFSFKFLNNPEEYINIWKFDLKNKSDISLWFASEAEEYKNNIIRHCYFHPIISFYTDDVVRMRINILSKMGIIDPQSIKFKDICIFNSPKHDFTEYEKSILKNNKKFEKMRICELENMVHLWKNEKSLTNKANIDEFKKYFSLFFQIYDISYDFAKFYIFKVKMEAKNIGLIKKNKFTNFDLEIKPWKEPLINETQCLGLLNINQILPKVEIRVGTYVLFYFTDLYI